MPRDSNGVYTLPNTVNPVVSDTTITTEWANTTLADLASVITSCLDRAGRGAMQANLQMGDFRITGLANGVNSQDAVTKAQLDLKLNSSAVSAFGGTLIDDADAATAQQTLGGTTVGRAVFTAADAAAGRTALGADVYKSVPGNAALTAGEMYKATTGFTLTTGAPEGTVYAIYNNSAAAITITQGSGLTLRLAGTTSTGSRTLAARGMVSVWALSTTEYIISGAGLS